MNSGVWVVFGVVAYVLLFTGGISGYMIWKAKRRGGRRPIDFKLRRGPGETLRRRVAAYDENFSGKWCAGAFVPLLAPAPFFFLLERFKPESWGELWLWAGVVIATFLVALAFAARSAFRDLLRYRADALGYLGERHVGEQLQPLLKRGYEVFHDMPAEGKKSDFNLDHITIGPTGVAVIETKTRRKGRPRPDGRDYKVTSDGVSLHWPWGRQSSELTQASAQADWLRDFIKLRTGIETPVRAVVAIPGWWVEETSRKAVAVVNAKAVCRAVEGNGAVILSSEQIDLITRQIDERCRDVED